ncbi:F-box/LRR-repeat protein [Trifolium repens]|nr:F-box/LRR-repeat protein [Trifolium repens]
MAAPESDLRLPHECWESIFKFLIINDDHRYLESLSLVCKQFLSITNHLRFSLTICDPTLPFLPHLFQRFPNLTSLNLTRFEGDIDALLTQISTFPLHLKSLNLSNKSTIPANGLRAFAKKITSLTSLTCSNIHKIRTYDLVLISDCFPLLEELDLSNPRKVSFEQNSKFFVLPKLRKVNLSGHYYINDSLFFNLCKNCEFLEEIVMLKCQLSQDGVAFAIRQRPGLSSLSFRLSPSHYSSQLIDSLVSLKGLTYLDLTCSFMIDGLLLAIAKNGLPLRRLVLEDSLGGYSCVGHINLVSKCSFLQYLDLGNADFFNDGDVCALTRFLCDLVSIKISKGAHLTNLALFALLRNCPKLNEVRMENTSIGKMSVKYPSTVYPHLKSLCLANNAWLGDEDVNMYASVFPNLQLLDLSFIHGISEGSIGQVLRKCSKIRHLNLAHCSGLSLPKMKFKVPMLEMLQLSYINIDDEALHMISKSCFGLLQLDLSYCHDVTEKGVMQVIENCTQLREINLHDCCKVSAGAVDSMVFMRLSLRKITPPPGFCCSDSKRKLLLRHGCLVC